MKSESAWVSYDADIQGKYGFTGVRIGEGFREDVPFINTFIYFQDTDNFQFFSDDIVGSDVLIPMKVFRLSIFDF